VDRILRRFSFHFVCTSSPYLLKEQHANYMWSSCDGHAQADYTITHVAMYLGSLDIDVSYW